jgi:hypothetical protein
MQHLIVDIGESRKSDYLVFWGPDKRGYTVDLLTAGRYTKEQAEQICASNDKYPPEQFPMTLDDARQATVAVVLRDRTEGWKNFRKQEDERVKESVKEKRDG